MLIFFRFILCIHSLEKGDILRFHFKAPFSGIIHSSEIIPNIMYNYGLLAAEAMVFQLHSGVVRYTLSDVPSDISDDLFLLPSLVVCRGVLMLVQCPVYDTLYDGII